MTDPKTTAASETASTSQCDAEALAKRIDEVLNAKG